MKKLKTVKLALQKETIRSLSAKDLTGVQGGNGYYNGVSAQTIQNDTARCNILPKE